MSKFKVGDKVRITFVGYEELKEQVFTIIGDDGTNDMQYTLSPKPSNTANVWCDYHFELVTIKENSTMARRTFKQIKASPTHAKGTLFQEQCEDGTQPYSELGKIEGVRIAVRVEFVDRALVEEQPEWFVEVFKVEPEYMTREELDKYNEFVGKKKLGRPVKTVEKKTKGRPGKFERTAAMRSAQSNKMKAYYARKKRQAR